MSILYDDIIGIVKDRLRYQAYWSDVDEKNLRKDIFELQQDMRSYYNDDLDGKDDDDDLVLDDLYEDFLESYDDLVIGIDNILNFNLEGEFIFNNFDYYFYYITLLLLILNGYIFLAFFYLQFGFNMIVQFEYDKEEAIEVDRMLVLSNLTLRAFFILENDKNKKIIDLDEIERLKLSNNCIYRYDNYNLLNNNKQLMFIKNFIIYDYHKFNKIYYNIFYFNSLKYIYKNKHIFINNKLNKILLNNDKNNYFYFDNVYLSDYVCKSLMMDVYYSSYAYKKYKYK